MGNKIRKLDNQFDAQAKDRPNQSSLFAGVSIHVNGFTRPSHAELKEIMSIHGGKFTNYYSRSTVTHIICANLPDAKVRQYERERQPTPVVRPEWIVRSVDQGKILPINEFILWQLKEIPGQQSIKSFAAAAATVPPPADHSRPPPPPPHAALEVPRQVGTTGALHLEVYDPKELAAAQATAAFMRSECDVLKGPPRSSRDDPNFVESFYRASRLHFIGRWKARLEALMASSSASEAPDPDPQTLGGTRSVIHLDMVRAYIYVIYLSLICIKYKRLVGRFLYFLIMHFWRWIHNV